MGRVMIGGVVGNVLLCERGCVVIGNTTCRGRGGEYARGWM